MRSHFHGGLLYSWRDEVGVSPTFLLWGFFVGVELDRIRTIVQEVVESESYELVDVEFKGAGKHRVLRIFIDTADGVTHEDCQLISEQVGTVLDVEDLIPSAYTLEVSSPGLDRKLLKPRDFMRFEGHRAKVRTRVPIHGQSVFRGRLDGIADDRIRLAFSKGQVAEIPMDVIDEARLEVDWGTEKSRNSRSR